MKQPRFSTEFVSYPFVVVATIFCLLGLIACTRSTADPSTPPAPLDNMVLEDEPAIQQFLASAPNKAVNTSKATPTRIFVRASGELPLPEVDPFLALGDLRITGSPTLAGLTQAMYRRFVTAGYSGMIKVEEVGTTPGFHRYCETGEADLMLAARPIQEAELRLCMQRGRQPVALQIGINAVVVVVNPNNPFVENATLADLKQIFTNVYWNEVKPEWPAKKIARFLPNPNFGGFTYFADRVFAGDSTLLQKAPFTQLLSDQSEVVQEVINHNEAVGFVDYPYYRANQKLLKPLAVDGIQPEPNNIEQRKYPLLNPLLIYTDAQTLQAKPQLGTFLLFYLTHLQKDLAAAGNFAVSVETLNRSKLLLLMAMGNEMYVDELNR